jgi:hypothetical protein
MARKKGLKFRSFDCYFLIMGITLSSAFAAAQARATDAPSSVDATAANAFASTIEGMVDAAFNAKTVKRPAYRSQTPQEIEVGVALSPRENTLDTSRVASDKDLIKTLEFIEPLLAAKYPQFTVEVTVIPPGAMMGPPCGGTTELEVIVKVTGRRSDLR